MDISFVARIRVLALALGLLLGPVSSAHAFTNPADLVAAAQLMALQNAEYAFEANGEVGGMTSAQFNKLNPTLQGAVALKMQQNGDFAGMTIPTAPTTKPTSTDDGITKSISTIGIMLNGASSGFTDAAAATDASFSTIGANITASIAYLPGLLAGLSYMFGIFLGMHGIIKMKDHVENPTQTPIRVSAIRFAAGGALLALPIVYAAMTSTIGTTTASVGTAQLAQVTFQTAQ